MSRVVLINVVGLTPSHLEQGDAPCLSKLAREGVLTPLDPVFPAVTCSVQSSFLTGATPASHGVVGNGWYFRDLGEVWLWRQSNRLVQGEKIWDEARKRDPGFQVANLFWWYAMNGDLDTVVTPRPAYPADGRKLPDVWTEPPALRQDLNDRLGPFPLFDFWGPRAGAPSSRWIADAALQVMGGRNSNLTLVYLPHLDYDLQRLGPDDPSIRKQVRIVDAMAGEVVEKAREDGCEVVVLSEYGITNVRRPVHINRTLREAGFLSVQDNLVGELIDYGTSRAFAVSDHQIAHVYVHRPEDIREVKALLERTEGIERVLDEEGKREFGIDHARAGELVAVAENDSWFTYYYWLDDSCAPDFARTVDIHRKPGYDPAELFLDPAIPFPQLKVAWTLLRKKMGFRTLLDVIPLDAGLVKGSHGRLPMSDGDGPLFISSSKIGAMPRMGATDLRKYLLGLLFS